VPRIVAFAFDDNAPL